MDINALMKSFGFGDDDIADAMNDPNVQDMMQQPEMQQLFDNPKLGDLIGKVSGMLTQGGVMPDDIEDLMGNTGGMEDMLSGLFGDMAYDEIDLDEEVAAYQPELNDASDRAFADALKAFIKAGAAEIPEQDVCAFAVGYHLGFADEALTEPVYDLWLAYDTVENHAGNQAKNAEAWNFVNWKDHDFRTFPEEPFAAWREAQGYGTDSDDDDEMTQRIYDIAAVAVMELHAERFTEQRFGQKLPFIIEDYEFNQKTAIRAVKANGGTELFDAEFFSACGFEDD